MSDVRIEYPFGLYGRAHIEAWSPSAQDNQPVYDDCTAQCAIYFVVKMSQNNQMVGFSAYRIFDSYDVPELKKVKTYGDVRSAVLHTLPIPFSTPEIALASSDMYNPDYRCAQLIYSTELTHNGYNLQHGTFLSNTCIGNEHPEIKCKLDTTNYHLQHGAISSSQINGNTASVTGSVTCTAPYSVRLRAANMEDTSSNVIEFKDIPGLKSRILINNQDGNKDIPLVIPQGGVPVPFTLSSVLNYSGNDASGKFSGNALFYFTYD
ncbi:hypothetical protein F3J42_17795 [Pantoea sp. Ap-959]|uniref:MrpH family fimbial adhesin n=1 Tax=unclassified Pantoea TaxID=2630326 RepID=UPI0011B0A15C|nr:MULTISPECIES: hypothetical protein [unclassified Pantoea]NIG35732.1 hypothetical protein [Pantoea sp. Ap-959]